MRHEALPQSMTPEQLGEWLVENKIDTKIFREETPYTEEEIQEFEHKSSLASRSLDRLDDLEKGFKEMLKEGVEEPENVTIPPTKGRKILKANREWADMQIEQGHQITDITLYAIPYSEQQQVFFFDIEGNKWDDYDYEMTREQKEKYSGLFDQDASDTKETLADTAKVIDGSTEAFDAEQHPDAKKKSSKKKNTPVAAAPDTPAEEVKDFDGESEEIDPDFSPAKKDESQEAESDEAEEEQPESGAFGSELDSDDTPNAIDLPEEKQSGAF